MKNRYSTRLLTLFLIGILSFFQMAVVFAAPGDLDLTFNGTGLSRIGFGDGEDIAYAVAVQSDGKLVVAGSSPIPSSVSGFSVVRYNTDGSLDTSFGDSGKVITRVGIGSSDAKAVKIQADGKIVVAGSGRGFITGVDFAVARYNPDGSLDTSFDGDGRVTTSIGAGSNEDAGNALAIQADGRVIVAGSSDNGSNDDFAVVRYNADGSLDTSFDGDGKVTTPIGTSTDIGNAMTIQSSGKIVVAGSSDISGSGFDFALVRYNSDGLLDTSFDGDGKVTTPLAPGFNEDVANGVAIQFSSALPDKIVVAGYSRIPGGNSDFSVVRYNTDGSLDTSFDGDGKVTTPVTTGFNGDGGNGVAIQSDGRVIVAGFVEIGINNHDFAVVRYNPDGSLDTSYGSGGKVIIDVSNGDDDFGYNLALDSTGRAVVVGDSDSLFGVVRIEGDNAPSCDYLLSPTSDYVSARGGPCSFNVTTSSSCFWTAQTSEPWIVIVSDPAGTGNGVVSLEVRDNFTSSARLGAITVGTETFTIVQQGRGTVCSYSISPLFASFLAGGGSGSASLTTAANCGWQAVSNQSWITITSTEVGIGSATINYTVSTNTTGAVREGAILVGGQSLKVKQKGS